MRFSVGLWDQLFGKKTTLELTDSNGKPVTRTVSQKWLDKMIDDGKMSALTVTVNMLDPTGYSRIQWTIGGDITEEQFHQFLDPETEELYAMTVYEDGNPDIVVIKRNYFDEIMGEFQKIDIK